MKDERETFWDEEALKILEKIQYYEDCHPKGAMCLYNQEIIIDGVSCRIQFESNG